jgi:hypothetical protein
MNEEMEGVRQDRAIWFLIGCVFCCVLLVLLTVFFHDKNKAQSPQALLAAVLGTGPSGVPEWQPGMGPQPLMYHPAASQGLSWQPLLVCPQHGAVDASQYDPAIGRPRCPVCGQPLVFNASNP